MSDVKVIEGTIPFIVQGETYSTWYKLVADLSTATRRPLVVIHGGPGISHDYMTPLADLASFTSSESTPVILYDQIGAGRSSHITDKDHTFWTINLFISELENLLAHFGIADAYDVLGHSWGGMLAAEFIIRHQPPGLKHLVLANSQASLKMVRNERQRLLKSLPEDVQDIFQRDSAMEKPEKQELEKAMRVFYETYGCTVKPLPEEVSYSLSLTSEGDGGRVFRAMKQGDLSNNWDITDKLHLIRVPTLVVNGEKDFMTDKVTAPFFRNIEKVKWVKFALSSHMPHWEERERYMSIVDSFLRDYK